MSENYFQTKRKHKLTIKSRHVQTYTYHLSIPTITIYYGKQDDSYLNLSILYTNLHQKSNLLKNFKNYVCHCTLFILPFQVGFRQVSMIKFLQIFQVSRLFKEKLTSFSLNLVFILVALYKKLFLYLCLKPYYDFEQQLYMNTSINTLPFQQEIQQNISTKQNQYKQDGFLSFGPKVKYSTRFPSLSQFCQSFQSSFIQAFKYLQI
eukprot:TRINITY_DN4043_c0_g2_i2.p2 TRINITY_DN4043_c0_g2~~TRINITY_DN4043_c0_g2_i2.p2  ORF type:complete len:206 (-),score=-20.76 TRINITY_DN4043_c0_g2_i2:271-888(-)